MPPENDLKKQSFTDIFNDSVARGRAAFPRQLSNLFVTLTDKPIYVSPEIADLLTKNAKEAKAVVEARVAWMNSGGTLAAAGREDIAGKKVKYLSLSGRPAKNFIAAKYPGEMAQAALLDHELAHFIVREGSSSNVRPHVAECAADAYALLRLTQRFGNIPGIFTFGAYINADQVISGSRVHYTSAVFEKLDAIQKEGKIDVQSLSPQQTAKLAGQIATDCALSDKTLDKIHAAYAPVRKAEEKSKDDVKPFLRVMLAHANDADIYKAGRLYLESPAMEKYVAAERRRDAAMHALLLRLEAHEKKAQRPKPPRL